MYGICANIDAAGLSEARAQDMVEAMMQTAEQLTCASPLDLKEMLLRENDPYLKRENQRHAGVKAKNLEKTPSAGKWRQCMLEECRKRGIDYNSVKLPDKMESAPGLVSLCQREKQGLAFWLEADPAITALDVYPSIGRMARGYEGILPTLVPGSKVVLVKQRRILSGLEALANQGFPAPLLRKLADSGDMKVESDPLFADLAGNAYSGSVVLAVLLGVLAGLRPRHLHADHGGACSSDDDLMASIIWPSR